MAIIVTMTGETFKRYQVCEEDEELFSGISNGEWQIDYDPGFFFGAQAVRRGGLDESYRSLSSNHITKVTRK